MTYYTATKVGSVIDPGSPRLMYWPRVIDVRSIGDWPCDFICLSSTDHSTGGIYLHLCSGDPSDSDNWKSYDDALTDGDFDGISPKPAANPFFNPSGIGTSVETPDAWYDAANQTWYLTTHQVNVGNHQSTTLATGIGPVKGLLNAAPVNGGGDDAVILDYEPDEYPGDGHTGYFNWGPNPFPGIDYTFIGYSLHGGGNHHHCAQWGSNDGVSWTRTAILESQRGRLGLPSGHELKWDLDPRSVVEVDDGYLCLMSIGARASGLTPGLSQLYEVLIDRTGQRVIKQPRLLLAWGAASSYDEKELATATIIDYGGQKQIFYKASAAGNSSKDHTLGCATATLNASATAPQNLSPADTGFAARYYHDFRVDGSLPDWLEEEHTGSSDITFTADGLQFNPDSGWAGIALKFGFVPADVGRCRIRCYASKAPATGAVIPLIEWSNTGPGAGSESVYVNTYGAIQGLAEVRRKESDAATTINDDLYDWGYNDDETTSERNIGLDWWVDDDEISLIAGTAWQEVETWTCGHDGDTTMKPRVAATSAAWVIGAIEIEFGSVPATSGVALPNELPAATKVETGTAYGSVENQQVGTKEHDPTLESISANAAAAAAITEDDGSGGRRLKTAAAKDAVRGSLDGTRWTDEDNKSFDLTITETP
ncbi:hypothetical protein V7x_28710 [Crateriforma conspicua]|uniref:Uncharacterized protein n=1 Tax=Crateriforma conspicua TaxID=2527996 RepID=A0A5C6FWD9_9PLAN|nr:hypothetical protein [Crateriforma conspicua]TWU67297.1 hypothetical protein V7x_28710 [Crateriforma conspicua]